MKGLLLKDWYMIQKYCRSYILITAVIIGISLANGENLFFTFYPCMLCGMIPVTLLGYDERSGWMQYSGTMPYLNNHSDIIHRSQISIFASRR